MFKNLVLVVWFLLYPVTTVFASEREQIHLNAEAAQPVLPGMTAPAFTVLDVHGEEFHFDPEAMGKPVVLTFFRGGWCPFCNLHLAEMRHTEKELIEMGFDVWFISIDQSGFWLRA